MDAADLEKINKAIEDTIKKTVNGKIDHMNQKLDDYIIEDNKWKDSVNPSIEIMKMMVSFTSVGGWLFKGIIIIGGAVGAVYTFYKFIIK